MEVRIGADGFKGLPRRQQPHRPKRCQEGVLKREIIRSQAHRSQTRRREAANLKDDFLMLEDGESESVELQTRRDTGVEE